MELDLISLQGSRVCSSRFWGVCGFSMTLDSPPGFGSVRQVCFCSHVEVALSISSLLPGPYLSLEFLLKLLYPGPALHCRLMLARQGLAWRFSQLSKPAFCIAETCMGFFPHPEHTLCTSGLVCLSVSTLGQPSAPHGLCALLLAPWTHVMCRGASVNFLALWVCRLVRARVCELLMGWEMQLLWILPSRSPTLPSSLRFCSSPLVQPVRALPIAWKLFLLHDSLPSWGHKLPSWSSPSLPFLCFCSLSYLIPGKLACHPPPRGLRSRGCFVVVPDLDEFLMYLCGGWRSPIFCSLRFI